MIDKRLFFLWGIPAGVLIGLATPRVEYFVLLAIVFCTLSIMFGLRHRMLSLAIIPLVVVVSIFRGNHIWAELSGFEKHYGNNVEVTGTVIDDAVYGYKRQAEFYLDNLSIEGDELPGKVNIQGYGPIEVKRGDLVYAEGKLRTGFASYQGSISYAEYEVMADNTSISEKARHELIASTYTSLPEPHASLGLGFLAGFRSLLPETLTVALSVTGLTHIVAVSGYNTTIIASAVQNSLAKRGSRFQVVVVTLCVLMLFLGITGYAPSIVRACVVSGLSLLAWFYGRRFRPSVLLLISAAVTAYWRPLDYWFSLGWWLSFTAFFGILILAPKLMLLMKIKNPVLKLATETTSAQILTLPIIVWSFSRVSAISVLANLLVLPAIPITMLFTFIGGLGGIINSSLSSLLALPARLVMDYILLVVEYLSRVSWAEQDISIKKYQMIGVYLLILVIVFILHKHATSDEAIIEL